jgi:hypothetical protein
MEMEIRLKTMGKLLVLNLNKDFIKTIFGHFN